MGLWGVRNRLGAVSNGCGARFGRELTGIAAAEESVRFGLFLTH